MPYPVLPISYGQSESPQDYQTIRTKFESGHIVSRSKNTKGPREYHFNHDQLTAAEVTTWVSHWDSVKGGGLAFDFTDPRTSATVSCKFNTEKSIPKIERVGPDIFSITDIALQEQL